MVIMLLAGVVALTELNKQFFPNFALQFANVRVNWTGATAEDAETSIAVLAQFLSERRIHRAIVTGPQGLAGIVTAFDVLRACHEMLHEEGADTSAITGSA